MRIAAQPPSSLLALCGVGAVYAVGRRCAGQRLGSPLRERDDSAAVSVDHVQLRGRVCAVDVRACLDHGLGLFTSAAKPPADTAHLGRDEHAEADERKGCSDSE